MARRSGEPGPLPCRAIAGAIMGEYENGSDRG